MTTRKDSAQSAVSGADEVRAEQKRKAETFCNLHIRGNLIVLFNAWNAGSAKAVAAGGAKAIATSSWSVAAANGFGDGERIPLDLAMENLRKIVCAVEVPVTVECSRCSAQLSGTCAHSFSKFRSRGWHPSRIDSMMSGARNAHPKTLAT